MKFHISVACLLLLLSGRLFAQPLYPVDTRYPVHPLDAVLHVLPDTAGAYAVDDVRRDTALPFVPLADLPRPLDEGTAYWGKLRLRSDAALSDWQLHLEDDRFNNIAWVRGLGRVDVWAFADGALLFHKRTGAGYPRRERDVPDKWMLNRVHFPLPAGQEVEVVLRVEGNHFGFAPFFNASLRAPGHQTYHPLLAWHTSFNVFLLGVVLIALIYHVLQYLYLRQRVFFWFSLWLLFCTGAQAMTVGLEEALIGNRPHLRLPLWLTVPNGMLFTFWFFGRSFVNSREKFPVLDRFMLCLPLVMVVEWLFNMLWIAFGEPPIFRTQFGFHYPVIMLYSLVGFVPAVVLATRRDAFARYFGVGAAVATLFMLLGGGWSMGWIQPGFDPYAWGIFSQVVLYSFGIAYRQRYLMQRARREELSAQAARAEVQRVHDLDEVKTRFFANVSHEFRTPLTLILGLLERVRRSPAQNGDVTGEVRLDARSAAVVEQNARRLSTLVDQLLDLSRVESGRVDLHLTRGGMIRFLRTVVFAFESLAERENVSLHTSFPPERNEALYDRDKLEKITTNLLSNAFKYTPGGGTVRVTVRCDDRHLSLQVEDTGAGIRPEDAKRVFERFYRVEGT
ncbi:MAG: 7TM diverse intracellular signaling domain-containing protein, partial [Catalinimonas sp.]